MQPAVFRCRIGVGRGGHRGTDESPRFGLVTVGPKSDVNFWVPHPRLLAFVALSPALPALALVSVHPGKPLVCPPSNAEVRSPGWAEVPTQLCPTQLYLSLIA